VEVNKLLGAESPAVPDIVSPWLADRGKPETRLAAHPVDQKHFHHCAGICEQCRNSCQVGVMTMTDQEHPQGRRTAVWRRLSRECVATQNDPLVPESYWRIVTVTPLLSAIV
jgi:hypothetical protein